MILRNKHDNIPEWDLKQIEERLDYHRQEISAGDRLDGWTLKGHKDEVSKLIGEYHNIVDKGMGKEGVMEKEVETLNEFWQYCLDNGIDPYLQTK